MSEAGRVNKGTLEAYIPEDRRRGHAPPERSTGAALYADISGSMAFTEALVQGLGPRRGVEALTHHLNLVYDALIAEVNRYGGSVIGFSGDAVTCWLEGDTGARAVACAFTMQRAVGRLAAVETPGGAVSLGVKVAVATGAARRFLVGDPEVQVIDVLAGTTLERMAAAEKRATRGEVVLDEVTVAHLDNKLEVDEWRADPQTGERFAIIAPPQNLLLAPNPDAPTERHTLAEDQVRPWLLPTVYERLVSGQGEFLTELRPAVALFLRFSGLDYDEDESAGEKLDAYIRWVQGVVTHYEGTLIQLTVGDKGSYLYAAFGAPTAHEDDARRAVAVAQRLRTPPPELDFITHTQIGIGRGTMRTGAYGGTTRRTYGVLGDGTNLAARLMQHAAPGQVLVSGRVQEVSKDLFTWQALPAVRVKGKGEPVPVFSLEGEAAPRTVKLQEPAYALPMVGREKELAVVEEKLNLALEGKGQLVGITAEAGMGKSRLLAEVIRLATTRGLSGYGGECQSTGTNAPFLVWNPIWRGLFGLSSEAPVDEQTGALEANLKGIDPSFVNRLPLLDTLLNVTIPDNDLTSSFSPELRKASLEALLTDSLKALVKETGPLLLVLEDIHWIDPLSHDLLEAVGRVIPNLPVLVVMAYRPLQMARLQAPRVTTLPHFSQVKLQDFTPQEAQRLIQAKLAQFSKADTEVSTALTEQLTARAQGNPFYLEELINYLHDQGLDPHDPSVLSKIELPASLHSLILSRIDQLSERQKVTLKVASVIGRLFRLSWLHGYFPALGEPSEIRTDLEHLSRLDLTPLDTPDPELTYLFKHIVTREVAYESLAYSTRANLHEQFARYLETQLSDELEQHLDLLAHHYVRSENEEKKKHYLKRAAEASNAVYANEAALDYLERLLPLQTEPEERAETLFKLAQVQQRVGQWEAAGKSYQETLAVVETIDARWAKIAAARTQREVSDLLRFQGDLQKALEWIVRAQRQWEVVGDVPEARAGLSRTLTARGRILLWQGNFVAAKQFIEDGFVLAQEVGDIQGMAEAKNMLSGVAESQGHYAATRTLSEEAVTLARAVDDKRFVAEILVGNGNYLAVGIGDYAAAQLILEESLALAQEIGDKRLIARSLGASAILPHPQRNGAFNKELLKGSLALHQELGHKADVMQTLSNLGYAAVIEGSYEEARTALEEALALAREMGMVDLIPTQSINLGHVDLAQGDVAAAKAHYQDSLKIMQELGVSNINTAYGLIGLAAVAGEQGEAGQERAARLTAAAASLREAMGTVWEEVEQPMYDCTVAAARTALGEARFSELWAEGQAMTLDEAVAYALEDMDEAQEGVSGPDFEGAKVYALNRLEHELPEHLLYHSLVHTRDDVVPAVQNIAEKEGVTGEALTLLLTAAYFHDIGFTVQATDHEEVGVRIAREVLPRFGYSPEQIETISGIVMATKLPQGPRTRLEEILADADLDVLGRDDFFTRNKLLRDELAALGKPTTDETWYSGQLRLLKTHRYFTEAARRTRGVKKQENLEAVARLLNERS